MPDGTADSISQKGIDYYNKLINALLDAGTEIVLNVPLYRTITIYTTHMSQFFLGAGIGPLASLQAVVVIVLSGERAWATFACHKTTKMG